MNNPNCTNCKHYYITIDEKFPKACKIFNIKGKRMPSVDVKRFTGYRCPVFTSRDSRNVVVIKENTIIDTSA